MSRFLNTFAGMTKSNENQQEGWIDLFNAISLMPVMSFSSRVPMF